MNPTLITQQRPQKGMVYVARVWSASILLACTLLGTAGLNISCGGGGTSEGGVLPTTQPTATPVPAPGRMTGRVRAYVSDLPIMGATVTDGTVSTLTGSDGSYSLTLAPSGRKQITVTAANFGDTQKITTVISGETSRLDVGLLASTITEIGDLGSGATLTAGNSPAQVVLPANALVAPGNKAPVFPIKASLTPVDPSTNPGLMPGDYTTAAGDLMESFGALDVTFRDNTGALLNLAPGQTAAIRIPLASAHWNLAPPTTVPAFYYAVSGASAGHWVQEGTLTLGGSGINQYYEGTVAHFTIWNADLAVQTAYITGKVVRNNGTTVVSNALVTATGSDYVGISTASSAADGTFTIAVKAGGKFILTASSLNVSGNLLVSPTPDIVITGGGGGTTASIPASSSNNNKDGTIIVDGYLNLTGTLRDFSPSTPYISAALTPPVTVSGAVAPFDPTKPWINPDFEAKYGSQWNNMVKVDLGLDNKPIYNSPTYDNSLIHSADTFKAWFNDFPGVHGPAGADPYQIQYTIPLAEKDPVGAPGIYTYLSDSQFPIDGRLQGDYVYNNPGDGNSGGSKNGTTSNHNFHYTYELHTTFTYKKGQVFTFKGDDDVWVFINKKLVIDLGGVHSSLEKTITLNDTAKSTDGVLLGMIEGQEYQFDFFYCERHTTESHMRITTSIPLQSVKIPDPSS